LLRLLRSASLRRRVGWPCGVEIGFGRVGGDGGGGGGAARGVGVQGKMRWEWKYFWVGSYFGREGEGDRRERRLVKAAFRARFFGLGAEL
jgi:hypothetical protein